MEDQTSTLLDLLAGSGRSLHALLTRLTLREDVAEDLMQELFMRLVRSKGFAKAANKIAYARRSAMHLAFDWRRSRKRDPATKELGPCAVVTTDSPLSRLVQKEQFEQVLDATSLLGVLCRDAFVMRYIQQKEYATIADELGKTRHQVRALCHKAVERIRSALDGERSCASSKEQAHGHD